MVKLGTADSLLWRSFKVSKNIANGFKALKVRKSLLQFCRSPRAPRLNKHLIKFRLIDDPVC